MSLETCQNQSPDTPSDGASSVQSVQSSPGVSSPADVERTADSGPKRSADVTRKAASGCRISSGGGSGLSLNPETCAARPRCWTRITPRRRYVCRPCRSRRRPALDRRSGDARQVMRRQQWTATGAPTGKPCLWSLRIALASASELSVLWTTVVKLDEVRRLTSSRGGEDMLLGI